VEKAIRSGHEESPLKEVKAGFVLGGEEFLEDSAERDYANVISQDLTHC
jgi:hypothetical protein